MKKIRIAFTVTAMVTAISLAIGSSSNSSTLYVLGKNFLGECTIGDPDSLEDDCGTLGVYRCTVYLPITDERAPAYQALTSICAIPMYRW